MLPQLIDQFTPNGEIPDNHHDVVAQALSGLVNITGQPENGGPAVHAVPTKHGNWMAWYSGGGFASFAALSALHFRNRTGKGQLIDVSEAESLMRFLDYSQYGGGPLLGVRGVPIICHGSSTANAIKNAIKKAVESVRGGLSEHIAAEFALHEQKPVR